MSQYFDPDHPDVKGPDGHVSWALTNMGMGKQVSPVPPSKGLTVNDDGINVTLSADGGSVTDDNGLQWLPAPYGGVNANHTLKGRTRDTTTGVANDWLSTFDSVDVYYTVVEGNDGNAKVCHWSPTLVIPMTEEKQWMVLEMEALIEATLVATAPVITLPPAKLELDASTGNVAAPAVPSVTLALFVADSFIGGTDVATPPLVSLIATSSGPTGIDWRFVLSFNGVATSTTSAILSLPDTHVGDNPPAGESTTNDIDSVSDTWAMYAVNESMMDLALLGGV